METNMFEPWNVYLEKMEALPQNIMETTHKAVDPMIDMVCVAAMTSNNMWASWEKYMGTDNVFVKWPMEWMASNRKFMVSYEAAEQSFQDALKGEVDYWFAGQKKLRRSFFRV